MAVEQDIRELWERLIALEKRVAIFEYQEEECEVLGEIIHDTGLIPFGESGTVEPDLSDEDEEQ